MPDGTYQALKSFALLVIWFINSKESLESNLFMINLRGSSSIIRDWDILHRFYATVCMPCYKLGHFITIISSSIASGSDLRHTDDTNWLKSLISWSVHDVCAVVYSLFIVAPVFCCVWSLFCYEILYVLSSFAIIQQGTRESCWFDFSCLLGAMSLLLLFVSSCGAIGWSVVCECCISWSYSLLF